MSNQNEFQYLEAKEFLRLPVIEMGDIKSFTRLANANDIKYIFRIAHGENVEFFFPHDNIVYKLNGGGFLKLTDMQEAQNGNFPGAKEYYEAAKADYKTYHEYLDAQSGTYNKEEYDAAAKAGFNRDNFDKFKSKYHQYKKAPYTSVIASDIDNPVKLHKYAFEKDIKNYKDFEKIYNAGFNDMLSYNDANVNGFTNASNYYDAKTKGFGNPKEYKEAMALDMKNKKEYDEYRFLEDESRQRDFTYDQLQLFLALSNCKNGELISIAAAKKLLQNEQEKLMKRAGLEGQQFLPLWYKRSIDKEDKLVEFLKTNEELRKFGFFNKGKNSFEIFNASMVKILVDGSNVAHNGKPVPDLDNIRAMIKELKFWKFESIIILVDASLRHKLKYPLKLEELKNELKKQYECHEVPSKTSADEFLIAMAKKEKCRIVTNDEFKDWKKKDDFVRDHIDNIRVPFRILKGEKVLLSGLEKLREQTVEA